ncbi:MAG TPA: bifunctional [glutamate--ammonia ligase]-adenylyl-L-tyrosine phosphorylase/[glutamate--ammonia-ligase] adenylyltransferase [Anaeromyxobacteraceae bacterium]
MPAHAIPGLVPAPFRAPDAPERLGRLRGRFPDRVAALEAACRAAPDPDLALAGVERYADSAGALPAEPDLLQALALLCGASRMIAGLLARAPHLLRRAARSPHLDAARTEAALRHLLARATARLEPDDAPGFHRLLRRLRAREVVRIALRDLRRARMSEVTAELSALATACLDAAIRFHDRRLRARHGAPAGLAGREPGAGFCALAMGKLGASELNFSSDIDLIYVYAEDGMTEAENGVTHFAHYAKLAELVTEAIATPTDDGSVFRVDLNLRPDGQNGPIVNSVRAAELYYQSFGRSWERNALVKARPAAGDLRAGEQLLALLEPFVWRRSLDLDVLREIQAMKARIDARAGAEGRGDLKLGKGGIREVEFFVTALQLLHGGKQPELRERAVLPSLERLLFAGVVPARDRDALADAYLFLRRAEHRVQMVDGRQTHSLPPRGERLGLARAMGFDTPERFEEALGAHRDRVAALFGDLLGTGAGEVKLDPELSLLADPQVSEPRRRAIALERGLSDPERAVAALEALGRRRTPFSRMGDPVAAVSLLQEVLATPDPDQALGFLAEFAAALETPEPYFRLLAEKHRVARLLLSLFGSSDFLSKRFLRHPELLDTLLREDTVVLRKAKDAFRLDLDQRLEPAPGEAPDEILERQLAELRRYKNEEVLRIAIHDIADVLPLSSVAEQLSDLAEACLERCLALAETEARAKRKFPPERLCVIAMGKLGGRELGYHSDLDLVFLYRDPTGGERHGEYARLAQRLMSFLQMPLREGFLYKIDTRLRPSGNQGALVTSAAGFARYHTGAGGDAPVRSQLWERQALLRARFVAGDGRLFEEIEEQVLLPAIWSRPPDGAALAAEIRRMRERIEGEVGKEADRGPNPKAGRGGLIDVEFAAQYLQLAHGHAHPGIRTPSTPVALRRLREAGLLREPTFQSLAKGYDFLRRLELRLRIVHDYTIDHLPTGRIALAQLARRLGYYGEDPGARLGADYQRVTGEVRAAFDEVVR